MPIRLVLADDHHFILDGLESLFRLEEDFQVVARCTNGEEILQAVRQHRPDILILDIRMPGKDGLAIAREIQSERLPTRIVLLTAELDEDQLLEAVRLGVQGIVGQLNNSANVIIYFMRQEYNSSMIRCVRPCLWNFV